MIFTWRAIRTPGERQRRQPKRRIPSAETSSAAAQSNLASIPPEVSLPREDNAVQDVVDQFFQPVKVTFFFSNPISNFVLWCSLSFVVI